MAFDLRAQLPPSLQQRIDAWLTSPPKRQFKQYGPLNAYLQGHKFPSDRFLVKPQALLRLLVDGEEVTGIDRYPDFDVDQYWGPDHDTNPHSDVVRVVIEIGSRLDKDLKTVQCQVESNLLQYMEAVGRRAHARLLGIGIVGDTAIVIMWRTREWFGIPKNPVFDAGSTRWISLFDQRVCNALDEMVDFCLRDQPHGPIP